MRRLLTTAWMMTVSRNGSKRMSNQQRRPNIAVIGGGAAGLAATRILQRSPAMTDITLLERDTTVGGVWNYDEGNPRKPMYKRLRTNLPKEIMAFREFPWPATDGSFLSHQCVQAYLQEYCGRFGLGEYLHSNCCVDQLTRLPESESLVSPAGESWPRLRLEWRGQNVDGVESHHSDTFDAVFVCNGHYNCPRIPEIPGLKEHFRGQVVHSIEYDVPETFSGQRVLCVGGRASGSDIAREIASQPGTTVYVSDTTFSATQPISAHNVTWTSRTTAILPDGRVSFAPGAGDEEQRHIDPVAFDTIIWCSGYDYQFPFINEKSGIELDARSRRCTPLFEQLWHAELPNVAFVGLPHTVLPFPLFELQAEAVERSWRGDAILPPLPERRSHAAAAAMSGGRGKQNGRVPDDTHYLGDAQWDYCRDMARYANLLDTKVEAYLDMNQVRGYCRFLYAFAFFRLSSTSDFLCVVRLRVEDL